MPPAPIPVRPPAFYPHGISATIFRGALYLGDASHLFWAIALLSLLTLVVIHATGRSASAAAPAAR